MWGDASKKATKRESPTQSASALNHGIFFMLFAPIGLVVPLIPQSTPRLRGPDHDLHL